MSLKNLLISGFLFSLLGIASAQAESTISLKEEERARVVKTPPKYLQSGNYQDSSYVYISAIMENPDGQPCVKRIAGGIFSTNKMDVVLTAQISGFFGIDSDKEIPIATYSWSSDQQSFCQSVWKQPITLLPLTPLGVKQGMGPGLMGSDEPTILLRLRTSTQGQETLSTYANSLLSIAATVATGGAAGTVVGLTKLAGGPTATILAEKWNELTKVKEDSHYVIIIPTTEIVNGLQSKKFSLIASGTASENAPDRDANVVNDVTRSYNSPKKMLTIRLDIRVRRSMFDDDTKLKEPENFPQDRAFLNTESILNFPRKNAKTGVLKDYPTIYQQLNSSPPAAAQILAKQNPDDCARILNQLRDFGFNNIDRALVMGAMLDDAYPDWRSSYKFHSKCLETQPVIQSILERIYPEKSFDPQPIPNEEPEVATNAPLQWKNNGIESVMKALRRSLFFEKSSIRLSKLRALLPNTNFDMAESIPDASPSGESTGVPIAMLQLSQIQTFQKNGCIFGFTEDSRQFAALVFVGMNSSQKQTQYLLMAEFPSPVGSIPVPTTVWVKDLSVPPDNSYIGSLSKATFRVGTMCSTVRGKKTLSMQEVIDSLVAKQ